MKFWSVENDLAREVTLRECAAGSRLQVALEAICSQLRRELYRHDETPRPIAHSVNILAGIVPP